MWPRAHILAATTALVLTQAVQAQTDMPQKAAPGPLTKSEAAALRGAIARCWTVSSLTDSARDATVTLGFEMNPDGTPQPDSIHLIDSTSTDTVATTAAYNAARRAILRCGAEGFTLPKEKFEHWRVVEMTFDAAGTGS